MGTRPLGMKVLSFLLSQDVEVDAVVPEDKDQYWQDTVKNLTTRLIEDDHDFLAAQKYDLIISVNYNRLVKEPLLSSARLGCLNVHHSYNLRIRGRYSSTHAIILARKTGIWEHGTCLHYMAAELDAGQIVESTSIKISEQDTAQTLFQRCDEEALKIVERQLPKLLAGLKGETSDPNPEFFSYKKKDLPNKEINITLSSIEIYDLVRAMTFPPVEGPYITLGGQRKYLYTKPEVGRICLLDAGEGRYVYM